MVNRESDFAILKDGLRALKGKLAISIILIIKNSFSIIYIYIVPVLLLQINPILIMKNRLTL